MTEIIAQLPFNQVVLGKPSIFILILYIVGLTLFFYSLGKAEEAFMA